MEINGVANIKLLVDYALDEKKIDPEIHKDISRQLDLLERYMIRYGSEAEGHKAASEYFHGTKLKNFTAWHEIRANPSWYPTRKEQAK